MNRLLRGIFVFIGLVSISHVFAGNPDRQGEAGAGELLFNPWARSAGLHSLGTSSVVGVDAMRINVAGIGRVTGSEVVLGNARLYEGSDLQLNALGFVTKIGESGALGISLNSVDFGDIPVTTVGQPEGTGGTYSPSFFNLGIGYSYTYDNKISVGVLFRGISEALPDLSAFGFALDAGVQYVTGEKDNFRLGIALRNIGSPLKFEGEGLSFEVDAPNGDGDYKITFESRSEDFELPSTLNIGVSYDYYFDEELMLRGVTNFTSNSFSRDQIGVGLEFSFRKLVVFRAAYKKEMGTVDASAKNIYSGIAGGASIQIPLKKSGDKQLGIDYAYRATDPFEGTHNFGLRMTL
jgi:hypothetical protein